MQVSEAELFTHMQHHLAGYKVPRTIEFREQLPISAAGKILKRELVDPNREAASHES
jgi:long-chain acyl-CoA synthetase